MQQLYPSIGDPCHFGGEIARDLTLYRNAVLLDVAGTQSRIQDRSHFGALLGRAQHRDERKRWDRNAVAQSAVGAGFAVRQNSLGACKSWSAVIDEHQHVADHRVIVDAIASTNGRPALAGWIPDQAGARRKIVAIA